MTFEGGGDSSRCWVVARVSCVALLWVDEATGERVDNDMMGDNVHESVRGDVVVSVVSSVGKESLDMGGVKSSSDGGSWPDNWPDVDTTTDAISPKFLLAGEVVTGEGWGVPGGVLRSGSSLSTWETIELSSPLE